MKCAEHYGCSCSCSKNKVWLLGLLLYAGGNVLSFVSFGTKWFVSEL